MPDLTPAETISHEGKTVGIRMNCGSRYFYIFVDESRELQLKLGIKEITEYEELLLGWESQKLNFRYDPPAAFFNGNETGVR